MKRNRNRKVSVEEEDDEEADIAMILNNIKKLGPYSNNQDIHSTSTLEHTSPDSSDRKRTEVETASNGSKNNVNVLNSSE